MNAGVIATSQYHVCWSCGANGIEMVRRNLLKYVNGALLGYVAVRH